MHNVADDYALGLPTPATDTMAASCDIEGFERQCVRSVNGGNVRKGLHSLADNGTEDPWPA